MNPQSKLGSVGGMSAGGMSPAAVGSSQQFLGSVKHLPGGFSSSSPFGGFPSAGSSLTSFRGTNYGPIRGRGMQGTYGELKRGIQDSYAEWGRGDAVNARFLWK